MQETIEQNMEQSILERAERLFLEKGFEATSTTQIAKAVGCNQALVHYYFRTKDNLFNTIFETRFRRFFQQIFDTTYLSPLSFTDKIKHIIESHLDMLMAEPLMLRLIMNEFSRRPERIEMLKEKLHAVPEQLYTLMDAEIKAEIQAGRIRNVSFIELIIAIVSLNVGLVVIFPIAADVLGMSPQQRNFMITQRKEENVKIILGYLRS